MKRRNLDRKFEMAVHGLTPANEVTDLKRSDSKLDDNQKEALRIGLERAKERKRVEFLNKNKG